MNMNQTGPIKSVIDPVCGMSVDPKTTEIVATVDGQHYYFCAEGCRKAFESDPMKYLEPKPIKPKRWFGRYLERLTRVNQEQFGGGSPPCH